MLRAPKHNNRTHQPEMPPVGVAFARVGGKFGAIDDSVARV